MKKTVAGLFTSLFALITLASCQNLENDVQGLDPSNAKKEYREVIITADISDNSCEDESSTRTELQMSGNQLKTYWVPGDAINVFSAGESAKFVSVNTEPSRKAKFRGYVAMMIGDDGESEKDYVWGLYPYRSDAVYSEPDGEGKTATAVITTTLPAIQKGKAGTFTDSLATMIGRSETLTISYKNAYSGVYVRFGRPDIVSVTLRGLHNEVLAGRFTLGLDSNLSPEVKSIQHGLTSVTVTAADGATFAENQNYYMVTLPDVKLTEGYSLTVRRSDGYEATFNSLPNVNLLARNSFKTFNNPLETYIESAANIESGRSTGWVKSNNPVSYEIWYKTSDDSDLRSVYHVDDETGNVVDIDNCVAPSAANGHVGIIRFTADITEIDELAFWQQDKLTSITLPNSVQTIKHRAFSWCSSLSEANLGTGLKEILFAAFEECGFFNIDFLPEGLQTIDASAFRSCPELISVTIPSTVETLGSDFASTPSGNPFASCDNLSGFSGKFATSDGLALIQTVNNKTYFVSFAPGRMTDAVYTIPDDVDYIAAFASAGAHLKNVILPEGLQAINQYAFVGCSHLTSLTIPSSVERIDQGAFENCQNLEWIKMNCPDVPETNYDGGTDYGFDVFAFSFCPIYVPANLLNEYKTTSPWSDYEEQGRYMVADREIRFTTDDPDAVNELLAGYKAAGTYGISDFFVNGISVPGMMIEDLDSYDGAVYFNDDLTEIPDEFFKDMPILTVDILSDKVTRIGSEAFLGTGISEIVLPESVTEIGSHAFSNTASLASFSGGCSLISEDGLCLIDSAGNLIAFAGAGLDGLPYSIPEGVTQIVDMNSAPFSAVDMPSSVTIIRSNAFMNCANLSEIILSPSIFTIGGGAFEGCSALSRVMLDTPDPPYISQDLIYGPFGSGSLCNDYFKIYVPASAFDTYRNRTDWKYLYETGHLVAFRSSQANSEIWYTVTSGYNGANLDFRGIQDAFDEGGQWTNEYDEEHGVWVATFSFDLTEIPQNALYQNTYLKTVSLPSTVTKIGESAFSICSNLESVAFPASLLEIGDNAFSFTKLSEVILPEGVTTLGNQAFGDCGSLVTVSLPASFNLQSAIDIFPFGGSKSIASFSGNSPMISQDRRCLIDSEGRLFAFAPAGLNGSYYAIPDGVVTIGMMNQAGFNNVYIPNSVQIIDQGAFYGCNRLEYVSIGSGVVDIRDSAFENCTSLNTVSIPSNVSLIRNYAFKGCTSLQTVLMINCVTPPQLYPNNQTFGDTNNTFKIFIPGASYQAYCAATGWGALQSHFNLVQTNKEIWFTTVSGEEIDMRGVTGEDPRPFYFANGGFWVAVFDDPVTSIPDQAFWKDTDLKTMNLPGNVQSIGSHAFAECTQLESVKLLNPDALTTIGSYAFSTSQKLRVVGGNVEPVDGEYITNLPAVTSLGFGAFYQDSKITNLRLPVLETLNGSIIRFAGIKSLEIPNVKSLAASAIYDSPDFKVLNLPSVETMAQSCLGQCRYLEEIHIGPNVGSMEACLFEQDGYIVYPLTTSSHRQQLKIYMEAITPPAVSSETFKLMNDADHGGPVQVQKIYAVYVPAASEAAYEAAWADALSIALPDGMTVAQVVQPMP